MSAKLKWYSLIRPFDRIVPLRDRIGALETIVMRLANLDRPRRWRAARSRKPASSSRFSDELHHHLRPVPIDEPTQHDEPNAASAQAIATMQQDAANVRCNDGRGTAAVGRGCA